jgi:hypothetical protein
MTTRLPRLLGAAGVLAGALLALGLAVTWSKPEDGEPAAEVIRYWSDHETAYAILAFAAIPALAVLLIAFGAALRATLRSQEGGEASLSVVAFGGAVVAAGTAGLVGAIELGAARAAGDGDGATVAALHQLDAFIFLPWIAGFAAMTLAAGIGGLRTTALPRWLAWTSVAMGVLFLTPAGFVPFTLMPLWLAGTGVLLVHRERREARRSQTGRAAAPA